MYTSFPNFVCWLELIDSVALRLHFSNEVIENVRTNRINGNPRFDVIVILSELIRGIKFESFALLLDSENSTHSPKLPDFV